MSTISRKGGLFVATAAACAILLSSTTFEQVEANGADAVVASLRGGRRDLISTNTNNYYSEAINSRRLEEAGEGEQHEEGEGEEKEEQQNEEGNNNAEEEQVNEEEEVEEEEAAEEEDGPSQDNADDDDGSNWKSNVQDKYANVQDTFSNLVDRFDEDMEMMWSTSPSEWDEEFWKVFGVVAGTFTFLLSCILFLFCRICSGDHREEEPLIATKEEADKRARKKWAHRGRLFARGRTNDTSTVGSGTTGADDEEDDERPFVLIEDVTKNDSTDDKSKITTVGGTTTLYAEESALSPMTVRTGITGFTKETPAPPAQSMSMDSETVMTKGTLKSGKTLNTRKSGKSVPTTAGGIFNETLDVWSEFLGLKKHKYNIKPKKNVNKDEDDNINFTDDDMSRRRPRGRSSTTKSKIYLMPTGTYVAVQSKSRESGEEVEPIISEDADSSGSSKRLMARTPVTSNASNLASNSSSDRESKSSSPRRTALMKTKKLLKSIGGGKNKKRTDSINSSSDLSSSKGEALLGSKSSNAS